MWTAAVRFISFLCALSYVVYHCCISLLIVWSRKEELCEGFLDWELGSWCYIWKGKERKLWSKNQIKAVENQVDSSTEHLSAFSFSRQAFFTFATVTCLECVLSNQLEATTSLILGGNVFALCKGWKTNHLCQYACDQGPLHFPHIYFGLGFLFGWLTVEVGQWDCWDEVMSRECAEVQRQGSGSETRNGALSHLIGTPTQRNAALKMWVMCLFAWSHKLSGHEVMWLTTLISVHWS